MGLLDRISALADRIDAADPGLVETILVNRPDPAFPTAGPNRLTIHVPEHATTWSLGEGSGPWRTSPGIVAITEPCVFLETADAPRTAVSLGTSGSGSEFIPAGITGYEMKTDGKAFRHADKQLYFTTTGGDMIVQAEAGTAVLQSDSGRAEINAGGSVSIKAAGDAALTAKAMTPCPVTYGGDFAPQTVPEGTTGEMVHGWVEVGQSVLDLALSFKSKVFKATKMTTGEASSATDWWAVGASVADILASSFSGLQNLGVFSNVNTAKLIAQNDIGLGASISNVMGGTVGASVTGGLVASMFGTCAAAVGLGYVAAWGGLMAEMSSKKVILSSRHGDTCVQSKKATSIVGGDGVYLTGGASAQITAQTKGPAAVYGKKVYVGTASSHGLVADGTAVTFGKVTSAEEFASAAPAADGIIKISDSGVEGTFTSDSKFKVLGNGPELHYKDRHVMISYVEVMMKGQGIVELKPL